MITTDFYVFQIDGYWAIGAFDRRQGYPVRFPYCNTYASREDAQAAMRDCQTDADRRAAAKAA